MAVQPSYPGVYIQEIPSGVRTITGVPTAITAFIGRAARGPTDAVDGRRYSKATTVTSYADFERTFGGLAEYSKMSFAVRDYFLNGGSQAIIVRLYRAQAAGAGVKPAKTTIDIGPLTLEAAWEGTWGRRLRVVVTTADVLPDAGVAMGVAQNTIFNLTVRDTGGTLTETFKNLTTADNPRRIDRVLADRSDLLRWRGAVPAAAGVAAVAGKDPVSTAEDALEVARTAVPFVAANFTAAKAALDAANSALGGNDGLDLTVADFLPANAEANKRGLYALEQADLFNILCIPPYDANDVSTQLVGIAAAYCERRRAFYLIDPPAGWARPTQVTQGMAANPDPVGTRSKNSALYWPRIRQENPFNGGELESFVACGAIAGVMARTDAERGVWKAPAGLEAMLQNVPDLEYAMTDGENGLLNPIGVNALRIKTPGRIVYGARTLQGDDRLASEYKYVPIRRLALYIEESAYRGTQWAVFEPNDEPLWAQIRLNLGAFMQGLFRKGAFQGGSPAEAYFVKCDGETTTQNDINLGIVNIILGFAPLKPAEFVVISLQQMAGRIQA